MYDLTKFTQTVYDIQQMQPNARSLQQMLQERTSMDDELVIETRPFCVDCNTTDVFCQDCGYKYGKCDCETFFICMTCQKPALGVTGFDDDDNESFSFCPACNTPITIENFWDWPNVRTNDVCDDCYVDGTFEEMIKQDKENLLGPCSHEKLHICAECGIFRVDSSGKWKVIEKAPEAFDVKCTCVPAKTYVCEECCVFRSGADKPWQYDKDIKQKGYGTKAKTQTATSSSTKTGTTKTTTYGRTGTTYGKCRHYGKPLTFPNGVTVYGSSSNSNRKKDEYPDFGLYLDWVWKPSWRSEVIDWPDYGTPSNDSDAYDAIVEMYERAKAGRKVEVGCIGGHGRTGTVLGCMAVLAGVDVKDAVDYVHKNYCYEAIETQGQEWWIRWFDAQWNEKEFNEEKPVSWYGDDYGYGYPYSSGSSTTTSKWSCGQADHFALWVQGKTCPKKNCSHWDSDVKAYKNPQIYQSYLDKVKTPWQDWTDEAREIVEQAVELSKEKSNKTELSLEKVRQIKPEFINVRGYIIPKPARHETQHNPAVDNCNCDVCRYIAMGGSEFLTVAQNTISLKSDEDQDSKSIKMVVSDGKFMEVPVTDTFEPTPPAKTTAKHGERKGEFIYIDGEGWVWDQLKLMSTN